MPSPGAVEQLALGAMTFRGREFEASMDAAQRSGFRAVGISVGQCVACLERGIPPEAMAAVLRKRGLRVAELELVRLGERGGVTGHLNELVVELIGVLAPDRVHVGAFSGEPGDVKREFAALCERITTTDIAFEFMPYSAVRDIAAAVDLVQAAGSTRAKIVLDAVHFFRSGEQLAALTPEVLALTAGVQLSDLVPRPSGIGTAYESRHLRTLPGDGTLPLAGFLSAIRAAAGTSLPPVTIEPVSDALEKQPVDWVAERAMQTTARLLAGAGWP